MEHISDIEMIEYVAGRLRVSRHKEVQEHIAHCRECARCWQEMVQTWDALGEWDVDTVGHEVASSIAALASGAERSEEQGRIAQILRRRFLPVAVRVAATIIIAVGVGHRLGKWSASTDVPEGMVFNNAPGYLAALGLEWSSGLTWSVLEEDDTEDEVHQL